MDNNISELINIMNKKISNILNSKIEGKDFSLVEYHILITLLDYNGCNQDFIAFKLDLNKSIVTKAIRTLLEKNCIIRKTTEDDKRNKEVFLTQYGEKEAEFFNEIIKELNHMLVEDLGEYDKKNIFFLLKILNTSLNKIIEN